MKTTAKLVLTIIGVLIWLSGAYAQTCPTGPLKSYLESSQKDGYYCTPNPVTVTLKVDFPDDLDPGVVPVYNCTWTGPSGFTTSANTATGIDGTYTVSGTVSYTITTGDPCSSNTPVTQTCTTTFNTATLVIKDGSNSSGSVSPRHYWTFEPASKSPISIDGNSYKIPGTTAVKCAALTSTYGFIRDVETDLITSENCTPSVTGEFNFIYNMRRFNSWAAYTTEPGVVGDGLEIGQKMSVTLDFGSTKKLSQEYLIKFDEGFISGYWSNPGLSFLAATFGGKEIGIVTSFYRNGSSSLTSESKTILLDGEDRKSWDYYMDGEWHHVAVTADLNTGTVKLFIDGLCLDGFTHQFFPDPTDNFNVNGSHTFGQNGYYGANEFGWMDEIAIYDDVLPPTLVYKHYDNAINGGNHYSFINNLNYCAGNAATTPATVGSIASNIEQYPVGYTAAAGTSAAGIAVPIEQMKNAPFPRYKPNNGLIRNFPWIDYLYLGGGKPTYNSKPYPENAGDINEELALHWNYHTFVGSSFYSDIQEFANKHPEIPSWQIVLWPQLSGNNMARTNLNADHYRMDASGTLTTFWDPNPPLDVIKMDGERMYEKLKPFLSGLQRPLDLLNENGEIAPNYAHWTESNTVHGFNPETFNEYKSSGLSWNAYRGFAKNRLRTTYRDAMLESNPLLKGKTKFSYYSVDGMGGHAMYTTRSWTQIKEVQKNFPTDNFYATPDYYPTAPHAWDKSYGAWHGTDWVRICRHVELADGDRLFSPFVAAGWSDNPTQNIRPAQWLGLMKAFGVLGSEFYYTGFFGGVNKLKDACGKNVLQGGNPIYIGQDARHWAWQMLVPSYAQAITSRYETILREGTLLQDPTLVTYGGLFEPYFALKAGGPNVYTIVKKWENPNNSADLQYVISTSHQARYNTQKRPADKKILLSHTELPHDLMLETRSQGSTYLYQMPENDTRQEEVLIQLDGWHEWKHPTRWQKDFVFEAEVPDEIHQLSSTMGAQDFMNLTSSTYDETGSEQYPPTFENYERFETYYWFQSFAPPMTPSDWGINTPSPKLSYKFRVVEDPVNGKPDYRLYVRARQTRHTGPQGVPNTGINISLESADRQNQLYSDYMGCIDDQDWKWYSFGLCAEIDFNQLEEGYYYLDLVPENENVVIDKIILDYNKDRPFAELLPTAPLAAACGSAYPNPDPYVPTLDITWNTDCQGKVQLTSKVWPLLDDPCNQNVQYDWQFVDPSGQYFSMVSTGYGNGPVTQPPYISGTYENPIFDFPGSGTYDVVLNVNLNGTVYSVGKTITILGNPQVTVSASKTAPISVCKGESIELNSAVTGGSGPYTYSWFPSLTALTPDQPTTVVFPSNDGNGTANQVTPFKQNQYQLTVTDANGCIGTAEITPITINDPLCVDITDGSGASISSVCYGLTTQTLMANVCASGCATGCNTPTGTINYTWEGTHLSAPTGQTVNIQNPDGIKTARYKVTATDQSTGCIGEATVDLVVDPSAITVDVGNGTNTARISRCIGEKGGFDTDDPGVVTVAGDDLANPPAGHTYVWDSEVLGTGVKTAHTTSGNNQVATIGDASTDLVATLYTITQKDANGCTGKGYIWLDVIDIDARIESYTEMCGTGASVSAYLEALPNASGYTYNWAPTAGTPTPTLNCTNCAKPTATMSVPGGSGNFTDYSFNVTITEPVNGCDEVVSRTIKVINGTCAASRKVVQQSGAGSQKTEKQTEMGTVELYPNPNTGRFQLKFSGDIEKELLNVVVVNLQGKVITQTVKYENNVLDFEMDDLPRGVYFIRVFNDEYNLRLSTVID